jgi:hypothetical protein
MLFLEPSREQCTSFCLNLSFHNYVAYTLYFIRGTQFRINTVAVLLGLPRWWIPKLACHVTRVMKKKSFEFLFVTKCLSCLSGILNIVSLDTGSRCNKDIKIQNVTYINFIILLLPGCLYFIHVEYLGL